MDYKNAYLTAYNWNGGDNGAAMEGLKIANKPEVQEKIKALIKPMETKAQVEAINARKQQIDFILERIAICRSKDDEQSIIRYTDMLNKIYGVYKEDNTPEEQKNNLASVDTNTLEKLINAV